MVADSITDSEIFYGSTISRDFTKKPKANLFGKLKRWKIVARRRQRIYQRERTNASDEESGCRLKSYLDKLTDRNPWRSDLEAGSYKVSKCCYDYDEEDDDITYERSSSASSPTSVLKSKDSISEDCICCSHQIPEEEEEEEVFNDAYDNWEDFSAALPCFENDNNEIPRSETVDLEQEEDPSPNTSQRKEKTSPVRKDKQCQPNTSHTKTIHKYSQKKKKSGKQGSDDVKHACPVCSEEMDATDLSFKPCPCGYQLCLFCHNKINELTDKRCPGCRNEYVQTNNNSGNVSFQQRDHGKIQLSTSFRGLDNA